jgi:tRNA U34 5-methylaminomethyl-2-thiouridine-forming methyltransferase MnmC
MQHQIVHTADGSSTIFIPEMNEQYHSLNGALTESQYVYIEKGFSFQQKKKLTVFEVGFGTVLNFLLTAIEAKKQEKITHYISIEKYPINNETIGQLNYGQLISEEAEIIFDKIHACKWNEKTQITDYFSLTKIETDLITHTQKFAEKFDVVYFDAFGPDKQTEMWKPEIFSKIYDECLPGCVFVTYSAKGEVRRNLNQIGFTMERLPGPPGKKQMLRGIKNSTNL